MTRTTLRTANRELYRWRQRAFALLTLTMAAPAAAQQVDVGYPPARSPFRDLEYKHDLTAFVGMFSAAKDPAGVAPRSGAMYGLRYGATVGGPVQLAVRFGSIASERRALDPGEPAASRDLGVHSMPLFFADFGMSVNVTGQKSYRRLVPIVNAGIGFVGNGKTVENDPFRFGTAFAFTYGTGVRYVPPGRFNMRFGLDSYMYRIRYPTAYYVPASDGTSVVPLDQPRSFWKNNWALTVGASYAFLR